MYVLTQQLWGVGMHIYHLQRYTCQGACDEWMLVCLRNPCDEILNLEVMEFGGGALGKRFRHEGEALLNGTHVLVIRDLRERSSSLYCVRTG